MLKGNKLKERLEALGHECDDEDWDIDAQLAYEERKYNELADATEEARLEGV